ncbi:MAG: cell surface protein SprA [Chitinophagales bacterium]|nr:cell surface protein SprA [Bacteroidota bacterium]MCB9043855.1 cell surface protein SprA [Chitinophagales bacterium]
MSLGKKTLLALPITFIAVAGAVITWGLDANHFSSEPTRAATTSSPQWLLAQADSSDLVYPIEDSYYNFYEQNNENYNNLDLAPPQAVEQNVEYNPETNEYTITETVGGQPIRPATTMSFEEFLEYSQQRSLSDYWKNPSSSLIEGTTGFSPELSNLGPLGKIFGNCTNIDIKPAGGIDIEMGFQKQRIENPTLPERVQNQRPQFLFDMNINMSISGSICDKLKISTDYNTKAQFNFNKNFNLGYTGDEDDIIQKIEAGYVAFPLPTTLIQGSQSLFGIKTELKFGRLSIKNVISQQKSKPESITIQNGAQTREFEVSAYDYDEDRNFFLTQYHRSVYNDALSFLPFINNRVEIIPESVEVWITNRTGVTEGNRDVVAFMELGESDVRPLSNSSINATPGRIIPGNDANDLYARLVDPSISADIRQVDKATNILLGMGLKDGDDFKISEMRKLAATDYEIDPKLGFIALNIRPQQNDIVGVSFRFRDLLTDKIYQVGDLSSDIPPLANENQANQDGKSQLLFVKMLKTNQQKPSLPLWDLMMKNIYSLGAFGITKDDFRLDVYYDNPGKGVSRFIPEGAISKELLIRVLNLDRLNLQNDPYPDGIFDYIEGVTILTRGGKLIFPVLEPFGDDLRKKFSENEGEIADKYVFDELYDDTKVRALQVPEKNRFIVKGAYRSSKSNEYSLGTFNIPPGSVKVTSGGLELIEGVDYTVNYSIGRVTIINEAILNSAAPINIDFEDPALFGLQVKTFLGTRLDYWINDNFTLGATHTWLSERPFTPKVNYGDDPISNQMIGADGSYYAEAPFLTRFIDRLPFIETKEPSSISVSGEVAKFIPGHARAIGKEGTVFIDDFEGSQNEINLDFQVARWSLASTPVTSDNRFPEAFRVNDLSYGFNRARINWFQPEFAVYSNTRIPAEDFSNPYTRQIYIKDIFPNRQVTPQQGRGLLRTFNLAYFPEERGQYNFDTTPSDVSAGIANDGKLRDPETRWGGIQRGLDITDFEQSNVEFIEFWMLDPFIYNTNNSGEMYINLGNISEDILKDAGRPFAENALPRPGQIGYVDTTAWARRNTINPINDFFDESTDNIREAQDLGFDGFTDEGERSHFTEYLNTIQSLVSSDVFNTIQSDPSADNFVFHSDNNVFPTTYPLLERYRYFNGTQGNSKASSGQIVQAASNLPDTEDRNGDNALEQSEEYFEYKIDLSKQALENGEMLGTNYIIGKQEVVNEAAGVTENWYQFRVPIQQFTGKVGGIENFRGIQFMRVYFAGFEEPIVCRLVEFNLIRNQWRKYVGDLIEEGEYLPNDNGEFAEFNLGSVSIEDNSDRVPINYVLPPGVEREEYYAQSSVLLQQNEQSLSIQVCDLEDGHGRAAFKTETYDMRQFKRLRMFIHAEERNGQSLDNGDLTAFIRIGSDFTNNYYEYEVPLTFTRNIADSIGGNLIRELVWPEANNVDIQLDELVDVKKRRNYEELIDRDLWQRPYVEYDEKGNKITVVGSPDLGRAKIVMLGVRNPKRKELNSDDDGLSKCAEVWFNELRLSDFNEEGGWAAIARADMKLADFGSIGISGEMHTPGFGQIDQKVTERTQDDFLQYNATAQLNMDKLLPKSAGLVIPVYAGVSESISNPKYDPYDTDVKMDDKLYLVEKNISPEAADSVKKVSQTYEGIKSVNLTNVRKLRTGKDAKQHFYDIENFNATYAYTNTERRTPIIESENEKKHTVELGYTYSARQKYITPFKNLIKSKSGYLSLIKDFNFNFVPSSVSFRTKVDRDILRIKLRNLENDGYDTEASYSKNFIWGRQYGFKYNLARSIQIDYTASMSTRIDEPLDDDGRIIFEPNKEEKQQYIENFKKLGRDLEYNQSVGVSYNVPINKIPLFDWTTLRARYDAMYTWTTAPRPPRRLVSPYDVIDSLTVGNIIENDENRQLNAELNFGKLYAKSKFISRVLGGNTKLKPTNNKDKNNKDNKDDKDKTETKPARTGKGISLLRPLFSLTRASFTYNRHRGTSITGLGYIGDNNPDFFGQNFSQDMPGFDFIFGMQPDTTWLSEAAAKNWIIRSEQYRNEFVQIDERRLDVRVTLEPIRDLKIDLIANRRYNESYNEKFRVNNDDIFAHSTIPVTNGSLTISFLPIKTAFDQLDSLQISDAYKQFESNRVIISQRLQEINQNSNGTYYNPLDSLPQTQYTEGYGPFSQEVLIPSFVAAYTAQDANSINLHNTLSMRPRPNWNISYNGLVRLPKVQKIFTTINITHGYNSTLTVNSFKSNEFFVGEPSIYDLSYLAPVVINDKNGNFYVQYAIPNISVTEQFAPLLGIDFALKNGFSGKFDYKKARNLSLLIEMAQFSEMRSKEYTFGLGYKISDITLPFKNKRGDNITLKNDMNFVCEVSMRENITRSYRLNQEGNQPTAGEKTIRIAPSIDYVVNDRIKLALFYERTRRIPYTSAGFPTTNSRGGLRLSFNLAK